MNSLTLSPTRSKAAKKLKKLLENISSAAVMIRDLKVMYG